MDRHVPRHLVAGTWNTTFDSGGDHASDRGYVFNVHEPLVYVTFDSFT